MDRNYVIAALKSGFEISQIAAGLGVTASAVSQLIEAENLQGIAAQNSKFAELDNQYNSLEEKVIKQLDRSLNIVATEPTKLANILRILNGAKRRSLSEGQTIVNHNDVRFVQLNLPARAIPKVVKNANNEIIEVEGRVLSTMPSNLVQKKLEEHKNVQAADLL